MMNDRRRRKVVAAVDVGGTRIKAALVDEALTVVASSITATPTDVANGLPDVIGAIISDLLASDADSNTGFVLVGCGVVVPGLVDEAAGIGVLSANLGWRHLPIRGPLASRLGVPVSVGHDVRAGLSAEAAYGQAKNRPHALFLPLGTGIAAALMIDGRIVVADGWAGEVGHVPIDPNGRLCGCGSRGCLETVSSARAIERSFAERSGRALEAADVARLVDRGDPTATAVWAVAVTALAQVIATTVLITGIDLVIVGGGLSECGPTLTQPLGTAIDRVSSFRRPLRLVRAHFGDRAGTMGAALLAWDNA